MSYQFRPEYPTKENDMKAIQQFLTSLLTLACLFFATTIFTQNVWKGGTPGAETNWNHPRNWSENRLPDWSDEMVVIPDVSSQTGYFPVVKNQVPEIACLSVESGAKVTIAHTGHLTINGETTYNYGIINTGEVFNTGHLTILATALPPLVSQAANIYNQGVFVMEVEDRSDSDSLALNEDAMLVLHSVQILSCYNLLF